MIRTLIERLIAYSEAAHNLNRNADSPMNFNFVENRDERNKKRERQEWASTKEAATESLFRLWPWQTWSTYDVAEVQFRRAICLNQFEPCFKIHLAWCLYKEKKYIEARKWLTEIPENNMTATMQSVKRLIEERITWHKVEQIIREHIGRWSFTISKIAPHWQG